MANGGEGRNRHFILQGVTETEAYRYPGGGGDGPSVHQRNRPEHAAAPRGQLDAVRANAGTTAEAQRDAGMEEGLGIQVGWKSPQSTLEGILAESARLAVPDLLRPDFSHAVLLRLSR